MDIRTPRFISKLAKGAPAVTLGVLVFVVVVVLSYFGELSPFDGMVYDRITVSTPHMWRVERPHVLIVQGDYKSQFADDNTWSVLLDQIQKYKPKQVVFTFAPTEVSRGFYEKAAKYNNVIFGKNIEFDVHKPDVKTIQPWPEAAKGLNLPFGILDIPVSHYGIVREQQEHYLVNNKWYTSLEAVAAERAIGYQSIPDHDDTFRIDFTRGPEMLPVLSLERVIAGDLLPELIRDRVILVGTSDPEHNYVYTPLMANDYQITPLEFHGYSLETIISGNEIHTFGLGMAMILVAAVIVISFMIFQIVSRSFLVTTLFILLALYVSAAWLVLSLFKIWIPFAEIALAQILSFVVFIYYRHRVEEIKMQEIIDDTHDKLHTRLNLDSFYSSNNPWEKIVEMESQLFTTEWSIFFECDKRTKTLKEVACDGVTFDKFKDQRRDYRRAPYSDAIEKHAMIRVEDMVDDPVQGRQEFLMPLMFMGEVQGFWVFAENSTFEMDPKTKAFVNELGVHIAELLYHRERWAYQHQIDEDYYNSFISLQKGRRLSKDLADILEVINHRFTASDDYLNNSSIASIIYDVFGRVQIIDDQMHSILANEKIYPYEIDAVDLLHELTGKDMKECRRTLRNLMITKEPLQFSVTLPNHPEKFYLLNLDLLNADKPDYNLSTANVSAIERHGFLFEIIDDTEIQEAYNMKEVVREKFWFKFRNDLTSLVYSASQLQEEERSAESFDKLLGIIGSKSKEMCDVLDETDKLLPVNLSMSQVESYPIDGQNSIKDVIDTLKSKAKAKEIDLVTDFPMITRLVYASPRSFKWVSKVLIKYLLRDTEPNGKITIKCEECGDKLCFTFSSQGFGMPNDLFQSYLADESEKSLDAGVSSVQESIKLVKSWGGELTGYSEVDVGVSFTMLLKCYL